MSIVDALPGIRIKKMKLGRIGLKQQLLFRRGCFSGILDHSDLPADANIDQVGVAQRLDRVHLNGNGIRALLHQLCEGDPARFGGMEGRFSSPVLPGERLTVETWVEDGGAVFRTLGDDGRVVLDGGRFTLAG